ncbi:hypothetical protein GUITHDRAFT_112017 [Guillardia theta CCMP2712]|uniref:Uncharacterized protein n=1 Tax=Guillardia theta (strain CCMP2712) TaxID=905079 RepID=L1J1B3_GUITC|nr:hypothetical protein GUITHDRAFT_112017 [Guillardia theta CCMP2712]EKX41875.1 hypothetical protein GUITHDRAFT_112017 [Guillardia theta CCMP2712]|eukprot:XP_005828855.1 hypothetical protein GUITHDRAFT_112017 [Guillardia theta CCMP2712]
MNPCMLARRLFVGGIAKDAEEEFGHVESVEMYNARKFAFVTMGSETSAQHARQQYQQNPSAFSHVCSFLDFAKEKPLDGRTVPARSSEADLADIGILIPKSHADRIVLYIRDCYDLLPVRVSGNSDLVHFLSQDGYEEEDVERIATRKDCLAFFRAPSDTQAFQMLSQDDLLQGLMQRLFLFDSAHSSLLEAVNNLAQRCHALSIDLVRVHCFPSQMQTKIISMLEGQNINQSPTL